MPPKSKLTRTRVLTSLFTKLEPELRTLDFEAQEFACQVCCLCEIGSQPEVRDTYQEERRWIKRIIRDLKGVRKSCNGLRAQLRDVPSISLRSRPLIDEVREAHKPRLSAVSLLELAGMAGPIEYFRSHSLPDPAATLDALLMSLDNADEFLAEEISFLTREVPRIRAFWKERPILWWQKGGLQYVLERLFRERGRLKLKDAHEMIGKIRFKLDGTKPDHTYKGYSPRIATAIKHMPPDYRKACDRVLLTALNLPPQH